MARGFDRTIGRHDTDRLVTALSDFVNVMCFDKKAFAENVMSKHRTLQQAMFGLFMRVIEEWSKQEHYDAHNEYAVTKSKQIMRLLGTSHTPFI